jgi:general secretion pathway protein A
MSRSWLAHWGLARDPFSKEIVDAELWLPSRKQALLDRLVQSVEERASALLVGEPGFGKTCLLRALRHRLPEAGYRLTYCHNATLGRRDFYRQLCTTLGLQPKASAAAVFAQVSCQLQELGQEHVHPVLLLDESHLLQQDVLDHLHILLNFSWDARALLSVIMVGLPELWDQLELRRNRSLYSRLGTRLLIGSSALEETAEYVAYRLAAGGRVSPPVFEPQALALLHESSGGALRAIDRLASLALQQGIFAKLERIDGTFMQTIIAQDTRQG